MLTLLMVMEYVSVSFVVLFLPVMAVNCVLRKQEKCCRLRFYNSTYVLFLTNIPQVDLVVSVIPTMMSIDSIWYKSMFRMHYQKQIVPVHWRCQNNHSPEWMYRVEDTILVRFLPSAMYTNCCFSTKITETQFK